MTRTRISQILVAAMTLAVTLSALTSLKAASAQGASEAAAIVAGGDPPLTQGTVTRFGEFWKWMLDVRLTSAQRQYLQTNQRDTWEKHDAAGIQTTLKFVAIQQQVAAKPEAEQAFFREQSRPGIMAGLQTQRDTNDFARWLLQIDKDAHPVLAPGLPPLTRRISDSYLDVLCFMHNQVVSGAPLQYRSEEAKDTFAHTMAHVWCKADDARIKHWAAMPLLVAALTVAWPALPEEKRAAARQQFRTYLQAVAPDFLKEVQPPRHTARSGGNETTAQAMARMRHQHENYIFLNNMMMNSYAANMNVISNMGTGEWSYHVH